MSTNALCLHMAFCYRPAIDSGRLRHAVSIDLTEHVGTGGPRLLPRIAFAAQGTTMPIWRGSPPPDLIR